MTDRQHEWVGVGTKFMNKNLDEIHFSNILVIYYARAFDANVLQSEFCISGLAQHLQIDK